jgi:cell fate regulator YaaT (PSP1 superfamily)
MTDVVDINPDSEPTPEVFEEEIKEYNKDERQEDYKYKEGQILRFVRVRFPGHTKSLPFVIGKRRIMYGQKVVAMSDRGMAVGYINSFPYELPFSKEMHPVRSISKIASDEDLANEKDVYRKQKESEVICMNLIEKHKLEMNLTHVEFTQFGKKVVFYFIAPGRVDFRGLVKDLVNDLKMRIELRQISVRDRSAALGNIGPCGRELCCSSFLTRYGNVSVKMAKNQNLSINYSKLNGVCGQLKCCLSYEDEVYAYKRDKLPREDDIIETKTGEIGRVIRLHLLSEQFEMLTRDGVIKKYVGEQFKKLVDYKMPEQFEFIKHENQTVIGLEERNVNKEKKKNESYKNITEDAKLFAYKTYDNFKNSGEDNPEEDQFFRKNHYFKKNNKY